MALDFSKKDPDLQMVGPAAAGRVPRHALPTSDYFILIHSPLNWELVTDDEGNSEWLPRLKQLVIKAGVNGVRAVRGGPPDATLALLQLEQRGQTAIPENFDGGYVHRVPVRGGFAHLLKFDRPVRLGNRSVVRHDAEGFAAFRRKLVSDGVIQPPQAEALEALRDRQAARARRHVKELHLPAVAEATKNAEATLKQMRATGG